MSGEPIEIVRPGVGEFDDCRADFLEMGIQEWVEDLDDAVRI